MAKISPKFALISAILILLPLLFLCSSSSSLHPLAAASANLHRHRTAVSDFRLLNRRKLITCENLSPFLRLQVRSSSGGLSNEEYVNVTVTGVLVPTQEHWIAMITPANANVDGCPLSEAFYLQTGDLSSLPLLCHYPVKAAFLSKDPDFLGCKKKQCQKRIGGVCVLHTCAAVLSFHVINIRTDIEFGLFAGGFAAPCLLRRSDPLRFANPGAPLYGHLSSVDSTGSSMRLSWVSGNKEPQQLQYGEGRTQPSEVATFSQNDMCSSVPLESPAKDFGWHDPGFIHSAVMTQLHPLTNYSYRYGSDTVGWSDWKTLRTPPEAGGADDGFQFIAFGDMGKAPLDSSTEHYVQPGSVSVIKAVEDEVKSGNVAAVFHIGDISYATGFLVEWEFFLHLINPVASRIPYMTAIGNHERDYEGSGSVYSTPDSGGECGVAYETYFKMPSNSSERDKPWYSIEIGSVHFTVISTEHNWSSNSEQFEWMKTDMASVDRSRTPWLLFTGHRPMYSSVQGLLGSVDKNFVDAVEPLLLQNKVDLGLFGHVHNYERTCSVYNNSCKGMPSKDKNGIDTYDHSNYTAPVHAVIGMAGFTLDQFPQNVENWSLSRVPKFGYLRVHATKDKLNLEMVNAATRKVEDSFNIIKGQNS